MSRFKRELIDIYKYAIETVKPEHLVKNAIKIEDGHLIVSDPINRDVKSCKFDLKENQLHIIGGGKCVLNMAKGLAQVATNLNKFSHGCLSLPIGFKSIIQEDPNTADLLKNLDIQICLGSSNNLPDEDSLVASKTILDKITLASNEDEANNKRPLFIVLLSGGGSACLTCPRYIRLDQKLKLIADLVERGADIIELNKVRRYFSKIKGGQLARHILKCNPNSRIVSLILSDVIGDPIEFIASGPTRIDTDDHRAAMLAVLSKYGLLVPRDSIDAPDVELTPQLGDFACHSITNRIIGSNRIAIEAATMMATKMGYQVSCIGNDMQGSTQSILNTILDYGSRHPKECNKYLVICGGEPTVTKLEGESWGKGGRVQEMALDFMIDRLSGQAQERPTVEEAFLAGSTDGQDGPTDVAGCFATVDQIADINLADLKLAKQTHDSYNFWTKTRPDWLIKTGMTGTNVMDLFFYSRLRAS